MNDGVCGGMSCVWPVQTDKPESKTPRTDAFGQQAMDDVLADLRGEAGEAISALCKGWCDLCEKLELELSAIRSGNPSCPVVAEIPEGVKVVRQSDHLAKVAELEAVIAAKTAEVERLQRNSDRYMWLRERLQARMEEALSGSVRLALSTRLGLSFFDSKVKRSDAAADEQLDTAIDAALNERNKS